MSSWINLTASCDKYENFAKYSSALTEEEKQEKYQDLIDKGVISDIGKFNEYQKKQEE